MPAAFSTGAAFVRTDFTELERKVLGQCRRCPNCGVPVYPKPDSGPREPDYVCNVCGEPF